MPMVTVSISPEQVALIRTAVDCGAYASESEAVRDALTLWCEARRKQTLPPPPPSRVALNRHVGKEDVAHLKVRDMIDSYGGTGAGSHG